MNSPVPRRRRTDQDPSVWLTPSRLLSLVVVLVGAYAALVVVRALRNILLILLVALFLSFAMEPAVQFLARRGWRRGAATGAVFAVVFVVSSSAIAAMVPLAVDQVQALVRSVPANLDELNAMMQSLPFGIDLEASPELRAEFERFGGSLGDRFQEFALGAASNIVDVSATALGLVLQLATVALVTFYLVADGPRARQVLARRFSQDRQRELLAIWELAVTKTGGYIYSRLLLAVVCGVLTAVFLLALNIPSPIPLAIWVGITNAFIPVVGTYLGGALVLLVALLDEPWSALWVLVFLVVYQQLENYILAPRIQARTMDVHPAVAFVAVLVGGTLLGAVGALLALPATAIIQALLSTYVRRHELIDELHDVALLNEDPQTSPLSDAPMGRIDDEEGETPSRRPATPGGDTASSGSRRTSRTRARTPGDDADDPTVTERTRA